MRLYHLSEQNIGHMIPRIPESDYEDQMTPRICFSKSVQGCLIGINENKDITGKIFHVYTLDTDNFYEPDESQVPDVKVTQEVWIEFECDPKYQGDIQVIAEKGTYRSEIDGGSFEVPVWEWEQIDGNDEIKEDFSELEMLDSYIPHKNIITEASRNQILSKSKGGDHYANGGSRWTQKNKCSVTNSVQDYNKIDMDTFWKKDVLSFVVKVRGETDTYNVTIEFNNVLRNLQNRVKGSKNKFDRDNVFNVLMSAINNSNDVKFSCTCPDFKYRMAYHASKNGYKAGEKETRASNITNANDTKGAACKHVLFCLNNASWLRNVASVIVNYTNYCKDNMEYNYGKYMFPKIYGQQYEKVAQIIAQNEADERLKSDEALINLANALGKIRGRFKKGSNKNPVTQQNKQDNKDDNTENEENK